MATCKILSIKDCGTAAHGRHLKRSLDYIMVPEKTQERVQVGATNCQTHSAYEQMIKTKKDANKLDGRQGYHFIISFVKGETDADTAYEIAQQFVKEYLKDEYEVVYAVHDNTEHIHAHIIFNSVKCNTWEKYHYKKNDWAKTIQPIVNRICKEHGLSTIDIDPDEKHDRYKEWNEHRDGPFVWSDMIRRDIDIAVAEAETFEEFLSIMENRGYEIKQNKYLALMPKGMTRFRRCKTLGDDYTEEAIRSRIPVETIKNYRAETLEEAERIVYSRIPYGKRSKLSPIQKRYYARLYKLGLMARKPYSKAWQYKDEIRKMHQLQKEYTFLVDHEIDSLEGLKDAKERLMEKREAASKDRNRMNAKKRSCKELFSIISQMEELLPGEAEYQRGYDSFHEEHILFAGLKEKLSEQGYSYEEVRGLREHYKQETERFKTLIRDASRDIYTADAIIRELEEEDNEKTRKPIEENKDKKLVKQPKRR